MSRTLTRRDFLKLASAAALSAPLASLPVLPSLASRTTGKASSAGLPNIILVVFDTLSARHMSLYGYPRQNTPNLERFASQATVYHHHYAAGNFTSPGTASLLTGVYSWQHRAFQHGSLVSQPFTRRSLFHLVGDEYHRLGWGQTLWADLFLRQFDAALDTHLDPVAFSLFANSFYSRRLARNDPLLVFRSFEGLLFDQFSWPASFYGAVLNRFNILYNEWKLGKYRSEYPRGLPFVTKYNVYFRVEDIFDGMIQELGALPTPSLSYLHFYPPHEPYTPRSEFVGIFSDDLAIPVKPEHIFSEGLDDTFQAWARLAYDEYIAQVNAEFGRLLDRWQAQGLLENSLIMITTDHGQLFERGVHGHDNRLLYEGLIHAPLLVHRPGQSQRVDVTTPTSAVDLVPTILQAVGQPVPEWCDGQVLPAETVSQERPIFVIEAKTNASYGPLTSCTLALLHYPYKLIAYLGYPGYDGKYELYHLENDPEELHDLSTDQPETFREMRAELHARLDQANLPYQRKD